MYAADDKRRITVNVMLNTVFFVLYSFVQGDGGRGSCI